ncbi:DUF397 domain-containing protein [Actinomadura sp. DC4]
MAALDWRKSERSNANGNQCVEVTVCEDGRRG